jgi:carbohydrate diacid regulator
MDSGLLQIIDEQLGKLQIPYHLLDAQGNILLPQAQSGTVLLHPPAFAAPFAKCDTLLLFRIEGRQRLYLALHSLQKSALDIGQMAAAYIGVQLETDARARQPMDREEFYLRLLSGVLGAQQTAAMAAQYHVEPARERYCILLRDSQRAMTDFIETLAQIFPVSAAETILSIDASTLCVVVAQNGELAAADQEELAAAIEDTARDQGHDKLLIGVGESAQTLDVLPESYRQASEAIRIGETYRLNGQIFFFRKLIVERLLNSIPEQTCRKYYQLLFNRRNNRLLNEEMQRTIRIFMDSNLNLSVAARAIFIHRNTLVYRLDKLQAATGLDLRVFDDAATFKFLMQLGNRLGFDKQEG